MALNLVLCLVGFVLLYFGAEWLVRGSSSLARSLGVTPIVIGLTVVAFGTSAPEFLVSLVSAFKGQTMIAVGNVVGSNICNIALVLGLAAVLTPIRSRRLVVRRDIPIMLGITFLVILVVADSHIGRIEGGVLFAGLIAYTLFNYWLIRRQQRAGRTETPDADVPAEAGKRPSRGMQILLIVVGIAGVVGGAKLVVDSAVEVMTQLGVSQKFIGLTLVAFGTSLPELATSVVAAIRKEMDISLGNLVGSNVFNLLGVLGVAGMVSPIPIPDGGFFASGLYIDTLVMLGTSALPMLIMWWSFTLPRWGGGILLGCYVAYLTYLVAM